MVLHFGLGASIAVASGDEYIMLACVALLAPPPRVLCPATKRSKVFEREKQVEMSCLPMCSSLQGAMVLYQTHMKQRSVCYDPTLFCVCFDGHRSAKAPFSIDIS